MTLYRFLIAVTNHHKLSVKMIHVYYCLFSSICVRSPNQVLRLKPKLVEAPGEKVRQLLEAT